MRRPILICLLLLTAGAQAAGPEQRYIEARDRYIAKFSKAKESDETTRQHAAALKELAGLLQALVGPVAVKGLPVEAGSNVDTLYQDDIGFGHLDGLAFASEGDKVQAVVTTTALLKRWLAAHREDGLPQDIAAALKSDKFYHYAIQDAAFAKYAELPIVKPASASAAIAVLGVRGNGDLKAPPDEIDVVVVQGDKVFFIATREAIKTAAIPVCEKVWTQMMAKPVNTKDPRGDMAREDNALNAYTRCFAKEAPGQSWYAAAVRTAQGQLERLPLK
jgi:hypothetical protein